jgi:hypothetical protein
VALLVALVLEGVPMAAAAAAALLVVVMHRVILTARGVLQVSNTFLLVLATSLVPSYLVSSS